MTSREYLSNLRVEDPDNYLTINFASDSIKADAKIIQATYVHKGEMNMFYVDGGNPRLNDEFTNIAALVYERDALQPKAVEDEIMELISDEEIEYLVLNNISWNNRLIHNNGWGRLHGLIQRMPCFAISDYEVVRRSTGDTLLDFGDLEKGVMFADACKNINKRAKSAPRGFRCTIYANYYGRGHEEGSVPAFTTESEKLTFTMDKIMQDILANDVVDEQYQP